MPHSAKKVYLIHGWAANRHVFDDFIPRLPHNWAIHALNLPGHGGEPFTDDFDIAAVADHYAAQIDTPAHILGWSLGGLVALYLAARHPDKVKSLCLTASFAKFTAEADYPEGLSNPALAKMAGAFQQDYAKHIKQFLQLQLLHTQNADTILHKVLPDLIRHGAPQALQAALDAVNRADARPFLARIQQPVLLVYGQKDAITPPRMGEYLNRHLPNSTLHLIDHAAHSPFLSHADEFAGVYQRFIEAV
ncbi:pimeloyl-ACP methyl ester esterase BioH [Neisseria yangbaofengii]|uniref:pimeloyl-ACP methyl ester esterase BioH n=1 Tax=Neisseria yangbaofengii TaxID=2709396 RepID=UPI0013EB2EB6|nr:pimeloyl-ACP methyl ester esterase BioH [Neisseria yangbaofengii]